MKKIFIIAGLMLLFCSPSFAIEDEEEIFYDDTSSVIFGEVSQKEIYSLNNYVTPIQGAGASVDVISRDDIKNQNTTQLSRLLNQTMGVTYGQGSGGYGTPSKLIIRGSDRVLFSVDGVRIDNPVGTSRTTELQNYLLSDDVERIEVIRGPQGTIAGHTSTGGLVAMRTRRGSGRLQLEAESSIGGRGTFKERFAVMGGNEKFDHYTAINWFKTDDGTWIENVGKYGDNSYNNLAFTGNYAMRFLGGKAELRDVIKYNRGRKNIGMNLYNIGNGYKYSDADYSIAQNFSNSLIWAHDVNRHYNYDLKATILNNNYRMNYLPADNEPFASAPYQWRTNSARLDLGTQHNFNIADWNTLSVGYNFDVENFRYETTGDYSTYMRGHTYQHDVFVQDAINIKDILFIRGGARYSHHSLYGGWVAPNAAASLVLPTFKLKGAKTTFRGSWGMNRNTPTLYQRYGDGVQIGPWGYASNGGGVIANPTLHPEKVNAWDAGIKQSFFDDKLSFDFGFFQSFYRDYINANMNDYWITHYENIDKVNIHGYEGKVTWAPNEKIKFVVNYTFTDAENKQTNTPISLVSKNRVNGTIVWTPVERFSSYIGLESGSKRYYSNNKYLSGYVDANIGTTVRLYTYKNASLYLKGDIYNLLNQKITCGYAGPYRIFRPGINFRVGLFIKYNLPEKNDDV